MSIPETKGDLILLTLAHRGFSSEKPENTLTSILMAIEQGADYIEIDVHLSRDCIPIVIHDPTLERTTNYTGILRVEELNFEELKSLDAGSWFHPRFANESLPSLSEVLRLDFKRSKLMIEIKRDRLSAKAIAGPVIDVVQEAASCGTIPELCFGSFDPEIIKEIKELDPKAKTVGILEELGMTESFTHLKVDTLAVWHEILTAEVIQDLKNKKAAVWSFTVDDVVKCRQLIDMQVDGIITNNPRMVQKILETLKK